MYLLTDDLVFPPPEAASAEGIVAIGGDVSPERLVLAYSQGIFPWPVRDLPLLWFCPDPRFILEPSRAHVGRSLRRRMRGSDLRITFDRAFGEVIERCASVPRPGQDGTWITEDLARGYSELFRLGYAHSAEAWRGGHLVGGLYGVSLGGAFFGESMFSLAPDASKVAFVTLLAHLSSWEFDFVDCQVHTDHLERFGAHSLGRDAFLASLHASLSRPTRQGPWSVEIAPSEAVEALRRGAPGTRYGRPARTDDRSR